MKSMYDRVEDILISHHEPSVALTRLRTTASLTSLLDFLRADAAMLAVVASRSYRHRNGFDKIVLAAPSASPLKLVLHVWPEGGLANSDNIHDHRWDFSSVIICGSLQLEFYEQDAGGKSYSVMRYRPMPEVGSFELRPDGTATVSSCASVTMTEGSTYRWSCDRLHRAWGLPGRVTATLLVQGPPIRENTTVLVCQDDADYLDGPQCLYRLPADEVESRLAALAVGYNQGVWSPDSPVTSLSYDGC
jgi:hypothetical protein